MAIGPGMYLDEYKDCSLEELEKKLKYSEEFLVSDEIKRIRQNEIDRGIDDNNIVTNVETEIEVLKKLIEEKKNNE